MRARAVMGTMLLVAGGLVGSTQATGATPPSLPRSNAEATDPIQDPGLRAEVAAATKGRPDSLAVVSVEILHDHHDAAMRSLVDRLGGAVTGEAPGSVVQARVPVRQLAALALADGVTYVRAPRRVSVRPAPDRYLDAGGTTAEAVTVTNAAAWQAAGFTGAGVKVGIIDYFNGAKWNTEVTAGEVPAASGTMCMDSIADGYDDCPSGSIYDPSETGHGNAVAEIIHDLAPGAQLYLGRGSSLSDTYAVIDWFAANGVRIVNRSLGSPYDGPGDGTGELDTLVDYAASKGITWINSAGNEGDRQYWRGSWVDTDGDGWLEFGSGDESLGVSTSDSGGCIDILGFRWSDWGAAADRTDYDVYLYNGNTRLFPLDPPPNQQNGAPPIELDGVNNVDPLTGACTYYGDLNVRVHRNSPGAGSAGDVLELLTYQGDLERSQSASSAGTGIVDSRNRAVLAVGAIDPVNSGSLGFYSSQGPTNDGRRKPDIAASSGLSTTIFGFKNFRGTSAAAPTATGLAALLLGAGEAATAQGLAALVKHDVIDRGPAGPDNLYGTGELRLPAPPTTPVNASPAAYTPVAPTRVLDTRTAAITGSPQFAGPLEPEQIIDVPMAGVSVPAGATAVAMNVTIVDAATSGYAQVVPTVAAPLDGSSNLNLESAGQVLPNFVIAPIGQGGAISVYAPSGGHVLVDVLGYFTPSAATTAGRLVPLAPSRVLDTRTGGSKPRAGATVPVTFPASSGLPATGVAAVVVTVTAAEATAAGYVTAFPSGTAVPNTSTLNLVTGGVNANAAIVPLGADRTISLYTERGAHLIVDLAGYITDGTAGAGTSGLFVPLAPTRISDSRTGAPYASGAARTVPVAGVGGVPSTGASAVSFNFTAIDSVTANGYLQVWPTGSGPAADFSSLNWIRARQTVASGGIVKLGDGGSVQAQTYQSAHIAIDVNGYFLG